MKRWRRAVVGNVKLVKKSSPAGGWAEVKVPEDWKDLAFKHKQEE